MKRGGLLLVPLAAVLVASAPRAELDFGEIAREFRQSHGIATQAPVDVDLDALLREHFVHVRLGLLDVHYPKAALEDKERGTELQELCRDLLAMQGHWLDYVAPLGGDLKQARKDLKAVDSWVKSWSASKLRKLARDEESPDDLFVALKAKDKQVEASESFSRQMGLGVGLGIERAEPRYSQVLLMPTRRDFVEFVCFAGWLYPSDREHFWIDDARYWLECRVRDLRVIAMQFADPEHLDDWTAGMSMNLREETGLRQHVTQRGFYSLMFNYFGKEVNQGITSGLAINLVIDLFGIDNTRSEGDIGGGSSAPFEVFVPGGNPGGGVLPPADIEGRFREIKGEDYFLRPLRQAQKQGAEDGRSPRDKLVKFLLIAKSGVDRNSIEGPYLGTASQDIVPPPERFKSDYLEFYRAYKTAFVYWLRTEAGDNSKDSALRFARLLQGLTDRAEGAEFESLFPEIYGGKVLSNKELDRESLEGEFLRFLEDS